MKKTCIKKTFALYGESNSGKTHVLTKLTYLFTTSARNCTFLSSENTNDFLIIFNYQGILIGIATGGDNFRGLNRCYKHFEKHGCVIAASAWSNSKSADHFFKKHPQYEPEKIEKERSTLHDPKALKKNDLEKAQEIFNKLKQYISNIQF